MLQLRASLFVLTLENLSNEIALLNAGNKKYVSFLWLDGIRNVKLWLTFIKDFFLVNTVFDLCAFLYKKIMNTVYFCVFDSSIEDGENCFFAFYYFKNNKIVTPTKEIIYTIHGWDRLNDRNIKNDLKNVINFDGCLHRFEVLADLM